MINVLIELAFQLTVAAGGALMARLLLAYFDRRSGGHFKRWIDNANSTDLAIYYGTRILAVCLLFGLALS